MKIGIITALAIESKPLLSQLLGVETQMLGYAQAARGTRNGHSMYVVTAGVGKVAASMATQLLIDTVKPDVLLNLGVAGALQDDLSTGDVVIGKQLIQHDVVGAPKFGRAPGELPFVGDLSFPMADEATVNALLASSTDDVNLVLGNILSGDEPVFDDSRKSELVKTFSHFNPLAVDMESAAFAYVAAINGVPFGVVRAISDRASKSDQNIFSAEMMNAMTAPEHGAVVISAFIDRI